MALTLKQILRTIFVSRLVVNDANDVSSLTVNDANDVCDGPIRGREWVEGIT